jgi:hypothetical protein
MSLRHSTSEYAGFAANYAKLAIIIAPSGRSEVCRGFIFQTMLFWYSDVST